MIKHYITQQTEFPINERQPWVMIDKLCETLGTIIGHDVNIEAGAILCNHYNEREDDTVFVHVDGQRISTGLHKFGSLVGDNCRIGANAVLSPGTLLLPNTIVKRLELIEQDKL